VSSYEEGDTTARGWRGKKYYLSDEAIALLVAHCKGTPLTMSAYLDQLIKAELTPRGIASLPPAAAEVHEVLAEGKHQLDELRAPILDPVKTRNLVLEPKQPTKKDFDIDL
jgi:hypothetical protein